MVQDNPKSHSPELNIYGVSSGSFSKLTSPAFLNAPPRTSPHSKVFTAGTAVNDVPGFPTTVVTAAVAVTAGVDERRKPPQL